MDTSVSLHISFKEAIFSSTGVRRGIVNEPPEEMLTTMKLTAEKVYEPVIAHFSLPLRVISFYRSAELNKAIGGAKNSQHMIGEAIDMQLDKPLTNAELFHHIRKNMEYDQVIAEFPVNGIPEWVHASYTAKRNNRKEALIAIKKNGRTIYLPFTGNEKWIKTIQI